MCLGQLDVPYMGRRTYLTGAEMFDAVIGLTEANTKLSFQMRSKANVALAAVALEADEVRSARGNSTYCAFFSYRDGDGVACHVALETLGDVPVARRLAYDEDDVMRGHVVEGKTIVQARASSYSFVQRAVALNKRLMNELFPDAGKWIFSRIDLDHAPPEKASIELEFKSSVGSTLVKSLIAADGAVLGSMMFSQSTNDAW